MFASDNSAPASPEVIQAMAEVGSAHRYSYGADELSFQAQQTVADLLGLKPDDAISVLVPNGTGANVLGLSSFLRPWDGVIGSPESHITEDECGALEGLRGVKIYHAPSKNGKLSVDIYDTYLPWATNLHRNNPRAVSLTQTTELGTRYSIEELADFGRRARDSSMILHLDGARIANAAVATNPEDPRAALRAMTRDAGVGIMSLGATKNGGLSCDILVVLPQNLPDWALEGDSAPWSVLKLKIQRSQKQGLSLFSKNRYLAAQVLALYGTDLWVHNAANANTQAARLERGLRDLEAKHLRIRVMYPVQANGVWLQMPGEWVKSLQEEFGFYLWEPEGPGPFKDPVARLMTSWDTEEADVDRLLEGIRKRAQG